MQLESVLLAVVDVCTFVQKGASDNLRHDGFVFLETLLSPSPLYNCVNGEQTIEIATNSYK